MEHYMESLIYVHSDIMIDLLNKYEERGVHRGDFVKYGLLKYNEVLSEIQLVLIWQSFDVVYEQRLFMDKEVF